MLAQVYDKHAKKVDWGSAFAQPMLDGVRLLARVESGGKGTSKVKLLDRENQSLYALTHIRDAIECVDFTVFTGDNSGSFVLDGSAYVPEVSQVQISAACKKKSALTPRIKFHVYDAVLGTADFRTRYRFAADFVEVTSSDALVTVETVKVWSEGDLMHCQKRFLEQGYPGAMLRYGTGAYESGTRSSKLLKVQTFQDGEFEVIDYKMGHGKYENCPVFICCTEAGNVFDVLAPGSIAEKKQLGQFPRLWIGRKLMIKYAYITKTHDPVPFLPVAIAFRDKK